MTVYLLVVTPMHDEADNVRGVHASLSEQTFQSFDWLVVDDGSTDGTADELVALTGAPIPTVLTRTNGGGLIGGSAYSAWRFGVDAGLASAEVTYTHVMKLDADVRLPADYFEAVLARMSAGVGIAGGVIVGSGMREQAHHVPGPVKLYTLEAYQSLGELPSAIGFDVMDEVSVTQSGRSVVVVRDARFSLSRAIGASEGSVHGRYRNGRVCRWTGYNPLYFGLHALRYLGRRPFGVGSVAMIVGYLSAGTGPYATELRKAHARQQRAKLAAAVRNPVGWVRETYGY
jgi:dolichol-phosphate mannosyltransferase